MKVALITSGHENLGVEYISSYLKSKGHAVRLFFDPQTFGGGLFLKVKPLQKIFDLKNAVANEVVKWNPDIAGFSCMAHNYNWSLEVAYKIKEMRPDINIIFGGIHPTSVPEVVLANSCVDMVAIGESEESFAELLENLENNIYTTNIRGIFFKDNGKIIYNHPHPLLEDLDSLPFPDKRLFYDKMPILKKTRYSTIASRGCIFRCTYCCNTILRKIYSGYNLRRKRSVDNIINELILNKKEFNYPFIYFHDEIFSNDIEWIQEFSEKYKLNIKLPFMIHYHLSLLKEDQIKLLKEAGLFYIAFGLQSASEKIRREVCHRFHSNEDAKNAAKLCKKYEIDFSFDHILGLPHETEDELKLAVQLYKEILPNMVFTNWLTYFPGTPIVQIAKEAGLILEKDLENIKLGQVSTLHEYSSNNDKKLFLKYELLFDLIPLLPEKLHEKLVTSKYLMRFIPKNYFTHFFLSFLAGLKFQHRFFIDRMKYLFSKKNVP